MTTTTKEKSFIEIAVSRRDAELVRRIIAVRQKNGNSPGEYDEAAMYEAVKNDDFECAKLLIDYDVEVGITTGYDLDSKGRQLFHSKLCPFQLAVELNRKEIVEYMLEHEEKFLGIEEPPKKKARADGTIIHLRCFPPLVKDGEHSWARFCESEFPKFAKDWIDKPVYMEDDPDRNIVGRILEMGVYEKTKCVMGCAIITSDEAMQGIRDGRFTEFAPEFTAYRDKLTENRVIPAEPVCMLLVKKSGFMYA